MMEKSQITFGFFWIIALFLAICEMSLVSSGNVPSNEKNMFGPGLEREIIENKRTFCNTFTGCGRKRSGGGEMKGVKMNNMNSNDYYEYENYEQLENPEEPLNYIPPNEYINQLPLWRIQKYSQRLLLNPRRKEGKMRKTLRDVYEKLKK